MQQQETAGGLVEVQCVCGKRATVHADGSRARCACGRDPLAEARCSCGAPAKVCADGSRQRCAECGGDPLAALM